MNKANTSSPKSAVRALLRGLSIALLIAICLLLIGYICLLAGNANATVGGYRLGQVVTGSMEPTLPTGALILVKAVEQEELTVGDIISFISDDPSVPSGVPVTHRIVAVEGEGEARRYMTKGDANEQEDAYSVQFAQVNGKVVWQSALLGKAVSLFRQPAAYGVLVLLMAVLVVLNIVTVAKEAHRLKSETDAAESESKF